MNLDDITSHSLLWYVPLLKVCELMLNQYMYPTVHLFMKFRWQGSLLSNDCHTSLSWDKNSFAISTFYPPSELDYISFPTEACFPPPQHTFIEEKWIKKLTRCNAYCTFSVVCYFMSMTKVNTNHHSPWIQWSCHCCVHTDVSMCPHL